MWMRESEWKSPKTFRSHNTTQMITTAFKIDFSVPCMGMKLFTNQSSTPTTIKTINI